MQAKLCGVLQEFTSTHSNLLSGTEVSTELVRLNSGITVEAECACDHHMQAVTPLPFGSLSYLS